MSSFDPGAEFALIFNDTSLVCRGCLAASGEMKNMTDWGLADDFQKVTNIQITASDEVSQLICTACEDVLKKFVKFTDQCQQSDVLLKKTLQFKSNKSNANKDEETLETNTVLYEVHVDKLVIMITAPNMEVKILLKCPYCKRDDFVKKTNLLHHLVAEHDVQKDFAVELHYHCPLINCHYHKDSSKKKFFIGRKYLNQHLNKVHNNNGTTCGNCNLKFSRKTDYDRHLKTCSYIYICQTCDIKYKTNEKLLVHLMRKHPDLHKQYKAKRKAERKESKDIEMKKFKVENERAEYICDSPKRSFATQTFEENIRNDVTLSWQPDKIDDTKRNEITTQTAFDLMNNQISEDESIFSSETVSLSDIQTQTAPIEFGLCRSNKETITSETQSPDLSIKETQTCLCLYDSPKPSSRSVESLSSSPFSALTSTQTQTLDFKIENDALLNFTCAETQTCFDNDLKEL